MTDKYPRAWLVWDWVLRRWVDNVFKSEEYAKLWAKDDQPPDQIVQVIPAPEHDAIVAEAVAAERERLRGELGARVPLLWRSAVLLAFDLSIREVAE